MTNKTPKKWTRNKDATSDKELVELTDMVLKKLTGQRTDRRGKKPDTTFGEIRWQE